MTYQDSWNIVAQDFGCSQVLTHTIKVTATIRNHAVYLIGPRASSLPGHIISISLCVHSQSYQCVWDCKFITENSEEKLHAHKRQVPEFLLSHLR